MGWGDRRAVIALIFAAAALVVLICLALRELSKRR
jgi:hypothetical protein